MNKDILNEVTKTIKDVSAFRQSDKVLMPNMSIALTTMNYQLLQAPNGAMFVYVYAEDTLYRALRKLEVDALRFMSVINGETLDLIIPNI